MNSGCLMNYDTKTREQLIAEIEALRQRNDQLEALATRRQQMEEALRKSEQRLSLHIQQTPLAYVEWDLGFQVVEWNPAAERMFGYSKSAALGQHARLIVPEATWPLVDQIWDALLEQKGGTRSTNDNVTKDGRIIACEWYNTPLVDADGEVIGVASLVQDITERQQAEEALHQSMLQEEIIRKQSSILRELSTPLIPISDQVLVMPLVGAIDAQRVQQLVERLLNGIAQSHAQIVILDITGVPVVDTEVANGLIQAARAVRLLGAQVVLTGIRSEVAQTLVGLGVDLSGLITHSTLQTAIAAVY